MSLRRPVPNPVDHKTRLIEIGVSGVELNRLADFARGPEVLAEASGIVTDDGVGGLEDGAGGAIVLLETNDARAGKIIIEL